MPFVFLLDAFATMGYISPLAEADNWVSFQMPLGSNCTKPDKLKALPDWLIEPVGYQQYLAGFELVMHHISRGDSFLLNYTQPTLVNTSASLADLFYISNARYKVNLPDEFTCFSPETFVTISPDGIISSFPMKGTADASDELSEFHLLNDKKELAEHHTIVDLIRNDLSRVATNVQVTRFRYLDKIITPERQILQVSSQISGNLGSIWSARVGDIFAELLPAGSVTGAPKVKTIEVIRAAEGYERGWYTGVFGYFDGHALESAVLIRYIEQNNGQFLYKSGGGITHSSTPEKEYAELISKVYVPVA